jgi:GT2 family glycosyltransferase
VAGAAEDRGLNSIRRAAVSVGIPTWARGNRVLETIRRIEACDPQPAEIIVHVDQSNGELEKELRATCPNVRLISSPRRVGPGGGRHRCLQAATQPIFASFDDDSWPVDRDYFAEVERLFAALPDAVLLTAQVFHQGESCPERRDGRQRVRDYIGCGYAVRVDAYRRTTGHLDRACPYLFEEVDVALQLGALGGELWYCHGLRVFHDTRLAHHQNPEIVAGTIQNAALLAWLRYPVLLWPYAALQLANVVRSMIRFRRWRGIVPGLIGIPRTVWAYRGARRSLDAASVWRYLRDRRDGPGPYVDHSQVAAGRRD